VLEALKERQTLSEIAQKFEVHPVQVSSWKKEAQEHLGELFSDKRSRDKEQEAQTELVERLYQQIGQLQVELNWLKKKIGQTQQ
jgi:transposase-like protein